jgi:hypothetical protein
LLEENRESRKIREIKEIKEIGKPGKEGNYKIKQNIFPNFPISLIFPCFLNFP